MFRKMVKSFLPRWLMVHKLKALNDAILLTFDDGPDPVNTPKVLDILRNTNTSAIFFVIGEKAKQYPEIIAQIKQEGHVIGNHTYSFPHFRNFNVSSYLQDIIKAQKILTDLTGVKPKCFRPPFGEFNLKTIYAAKSQSLKIILGSNSGGEWNNNKHKTAKAVEDQIMKNLEPGQIIIMHDNNKKIPKMLKSLISRIRNTGIDISQKIHLNQL